MFEIRPIKEHEVDQTLPLLLYDNGTGPGQLRIKIETFRKLASREHYDLTRQIVVVRGGKIIYTCLFVSSPGRTAFIYTSGSPVAKGAEDDSAAQALKQLCRWAFEQDCNLLQVMLEPADNVRRQICLRSGFKQLTDLIYLFRSCKRQEAEYTTSENVNWLIYDKKHHDLFKQVLLETYRDSLDCPELENIREAEDVIRSHKSSGCFDPRCWKLLLCGESPEDLSKADPKREKQLIEIDQQFFKGESKGCSAGGVILLAPLQDGSTMELVYMGLSPAVRGRGLAKVLLHEALACAGRSGANSMVLAVDCRNYIAHQLYKSFGFHEAIRRTVLYYSSDQELS